MKRSISFKIRRDVQLSSGDEIAIVTSDGTNKFWLEAGKRQITQPIKGNRDRYNPEILWINRTLKN